MNKYVRIASLICELNNLNVKLEKFHNFLAMKHLLMCTEIDLFEISPREKNPFDRSWIFALITICAERLIQDH